MAEIKTNIISSKHLPLRSPFNTAILWWLALDYFHAPLWLWGVAGTIFFIYTVGWIAQLFTAKWISV